VGRFTTDRIETLAGTGTAFQTARILHPSPANPQANRGWADAVEQSLQAQGIWS
jgi:single-strand selective monofunctional uracil DNA glycosylase